MRHHGGMSTASASPAQATSASGAAVTFARRVRAAQLLAAALILAVFAAAAAVLVAGRPDAPVTGVEVEDSSGLLDPTGIREAASGLRAYRPTRIVVIADRGAAGQNLNEKTLSWARAHPDADLLSADGRVWADGVFLIALSVTADGSAGSEPHGDIGVYMGEDLKVSNGAQRDIQDAGKDAFRERNWTQGIVDTARAGTGLLARPLWASPALAVSVAVILACLLAFSAYLLTGLRRRFGQAAVAFDDGTRDIDERARSTEFIPDAGFGAHVRAAAADLLRRYESLLGLRDAIASTPIVALGGLNPRLRRRIRTLEADTAQLRTEARMVERSARLYGRDEGWQAVWSEEVDETRTFLRSALTDSAIRFRASDAARMDLAEFAQEALAELEEIETRGITGSAAEVDAGLVRIGQLRAQLSQRMNRILEETLPADARQAKCIREGIEQRRRREAERSSSLTGFVDRGSVFVPTAYAAGWSIGMQNYQSAQSPGSAGVSGGGYTTGYGGSAGGFSGAGSSSSF